MSGFPLSAFAAVLVATIVAVVIDSQFWWLPIAVLVVGVALLFGDRVLRRDERPDEQDAMSMKPPRR